MQGVFLSGVCRCVCVWGVCMGEKREIEGRKGVCECPCPFEGLFEINKLEKKKKLKLNGWSAWNRELNVFVRNIHIYCCSWLVNQSFRDYNLLVNSGCILRGENCIEGNTSETGWSQEDESTYSQHTWKEEVLTDLVANGKKKSCFTKVFGARYILSLDQIIFFNYTKSCSLNFIKSFV